MPDKFHGKYRIPSARLQGFDFGQNGAYFITICTKDRIHNFGEIVLSAGLETQNFAGLETQNFASLRATPIGSIAGEYWRKIPEHFPFVILDEFVVMPDHVHGIIIIYKEIQDIASLQQIGYVNKFGPQSGNISSIIRGYKAGVKSYATINKIDFAWQPRFYDRIIRDDEEMKRIRKYIVKNPDNWFKEKDNKEDLYM